MEALDALDNWRFYLLTNKGQVLRLPGGVNVSHFYFITNEEPSTAPHLRSLVVTAQTVTEINVIILRPPITQLRNRTVQLFASWYGSNAVS